jgi:hypothetical protein
VSLCSLASLCPSSQVSYHLPNHLLPSLYISLAAACVMRGVQRTQELEDHIGSYRGDRHRGCVVQFGAGELAWWSSRGSTTSSGRGGEDTCNYSRRISEQRICRRDQMYEVECTQRWWASRQVARFPV